MAQMVIWMKPTREKRATAEESRGSGRVHGPEWGRARLRRGVGSPGRHCVMMAKPIQDPTCGHRAEMRAGQLLGVGGRGLHAPQPSTATSPALHNSQPPEATVSITRCSQVQTAKATAEPGNLILPHSPPCKCWGSPGLRPLSPGTDPSTWNLKPHGGEGSRAGPHLIGVVGAGHQQEEPREGVLSGVWDLPGLGS